MWLELDWLCVELHGIVSSGSAWSGIVWRKLEWNCAALSGVPLALCGVEWHCVTWCGVALCGMEWHCVEWSGVVWYGKLPELPLNCPIGLQSLVERSGIVWCRVALCGVTLCGMESCKSCR